MKVNFQEIRLFGHKSVKCAGGCGKRVVRSRKFFQTLNPFNKNALGQVKDRDEIYTELKRAIQEWEREPVTCNHCKGKP